MKTILKLFILQNNKKFFIFIIKELFLFKKNYVCFKNVFNIFYWKKAIFEHKKKEKKKNNLNHFLKRKYLKLCL